MQRRRAPWTEPAPTFGALEAAAGSRQQAVGEAEPIPAPEPPYDVILGPCAKFRRHGTIFKYKCITSALAWQHRHPPRANTNAVSFRMGPAHAGAAVAPRLRILTFNRTFMLHVPCTEGNRTLSGAERRMAAGRVAAGTEVQFDGHLSLRSKSIIMIPAGSEVS